MVNLQETIAERNWGQKSPLPCWAAEGVQRWLGTGKARHCTLDQVVFIVQAQKLWMRAGRLDKL